MNHITGFFNPIQWVQDIINNEFIKNDNWTLYVEGLKNTLIMTVLALILGIFLGAIIALVKTLPASILTRPFKWIANLYTTIIRGTPVMVQLLFIYYVVFSFAPREAKLLIAALSFGLNSSAYISEIFRSGIQSVSVGQMEAGRSLGLTRGQCMVSIILPQAIRNVLPALFNEFIALLKETSIAKTIAIMDITNAGDSIRSRSQSYAPLIISGLMYLILVLIFEKIQRVVERRLNGNDSSRESREEIR